MTSERRTQERLELNLNAQLRYRFVDELSSEAMETVAANISSGGAFLTTRAPLPLSSRVTVEFQITIEDLRRLKFIVSVDTLKSATDNRLKIVATGIVIRREEEGIAIIFDQNYTVSPLAAGTPGSLVTSG